MLTTDSADGSTDIPVPPQVYFRSSLSDNVPREISASYVDHGCQDRYRDNLVALSSMTVPNTPLLGGSVSEVSALRVTVRCRRLGGLTPLGCTVQRCYNVLPVSLILSDNGIQIKISLPAGNRSVEG